MLDILLAGLFRDVTGAEVIIALGQPQSTLVDTCDLLAGVLEILLLSEVQKRAYADQLIMGQQ